MLLASLRRQLLPKKNVCRRLCSTSSTNSTHDEFTQNRQEQKVRILDLRSRHSFSVNSESKQQYNKSKFLTFVKAKEDQKTLDDDEDEAIRTKILSSSLQFVPAYGWTREAVEAGTETLGYPTVTAGVIKDAGIQLIHHHVASANAALARQTSPPPGIEPGFSA